MAHPSSHSAAELFIEVGIANSGNNSATAVSSSSNTNAATADALVQLNRTNDVVFVCGNNSHGECGIGHHANKVVTPIPLRLALGLRVSRVACGSAHSALVTHDGVLFMWGANRWGQLGIGTTENQSRPVRTDVVEHVIDVACGTQHTIALTQGSRCYAWGSGCHGQLGLGVIDTPVKKPMLVAKLSVLKCRQVSCGGLHSAALTADGRVYCFGWGRVGQLGLKSNSMHEEPSMVEMPCAVVKVVCGWNHTLALSSTGECYAWGAGTHGQTASPSRQHRRLPRVVQVTDDNDVPIPEAQVIVDIEAGARHSIMLTSAGDVYAYGCAEDGELGAGPVVMENASISGAGPVRPVRTLYDRASADGASLKFVSCGAWHSIAVNTNGQAYSWGYGADYRLGHGNTEEQAVPRRIAAFGPLRIDDVAAGGAHTIFVAKVKQGH